MEEVKRFMRYVMPGLVVVVELSLALWFSFPEEFADIVEAWLDNGGFGTAIALFLASGALGYLFSIIYYSLQNLFKRWLFYNHKPAIDWLENEKKCIYKVGKEFKQFKDLDKNRRSQWELFNVVWHLSRGKYKSLDKVEDVLNRLLDVLHGHGAHFIGATLGAGCWLYIVGWPWKWGDNWVTLIVIGVVWFVLLCCVWTLYFKTKKTIENIQNTSLICALSCCHHQAKSGDQG